MKKKLVNELRDIALQLPEQNYTVWHRVSFKNRDKILYGIIPNKHQLRNKGEHKVNHLRRIKRPYLSGGFDSIKNYVSQFGLTLKEN